MSPPPTNRATTGTRGFAGRSRGVAPVVGVALLVLCTVALGGAVALAADRPSAPPPTAAFALSADAGADRITITHRGGDAVDVRDLTVQVTVDGEPLAQQPPVPFFSAGGFHSGPTGPFNPSGGTTWRSGETVSFRVATTNDPPIDPGDEVGIRLSVRGTTVATLTATA